MTFANYARAPFNTWSFWNMDSVAHTAMLPRGGELAECWPCNIPSKRVICDFVHSIPPGNTDLGGVLVFPVRLR